MATDIGKLELKVKADERSFVEAHRKGAQEAGRSTGASAAGAAAGGAGTGAAAAAGAAAASRRGVAGQVAGGTFVGSALGRVGGAARAAIASPAAPFVAALGIGVLTVRKGIKVLSSWNAALEDSTRRLMAFDTRLAGATVRSQLAAFGRARSEAAALGGTLATGTDLRTQIANNLQPVRNLVNAFKGGVINSILRHVETISAFVGRMTTGLTAAIAANRENIAQFLEKTAPLFLPLGSAMPATIRALADGVRAINDDVASANRWLSQMATNGNAGGVNQFFFQRLNEIAGQNITRAPVKNAIRRSRQQGGGP